MAYQLVFTSYPTSLTYGRSGFSTVARSVGMPEKLSSAVERLSSYDAPSGTVYSHRVLQFSNTLWHVLSATRDSGVDYTNRNNYVAHHLVLSDDEVPFLPNPAEIILNWKGWISSWSGSPRFIDNVEGLKSIGTKRSLPAKLWGEMFGDAGKAALLGDSPACIRARVSDAETLLALFSESMMASIDSASVWNRTFSTYANMADDVLWKGGDFGPATDCVADIPSLIAMDAPSCRAAEYARSGEKTNREKYNLTVKTYKGNSRGFEVVRGKNSELSAKYFYMASAVATFVVVVCTLVYFLFVDNSRSSEFLEATESGLPIIARVESPSTESDPGSESESMKRTLLQTIDCARALVEANKFSDAISVWEESPYAKNNPNYAAQLLSDISSRIQYLLNYAERILSAGGENSLKLASSQLEAVRGALDLKNIPKRESILKRWGTLKERIEQK